MRRLPIFIALSALLISAAGCAAHNPPMPSSASAQPAAPAPDGGTRERLAVTTAELSVAVEDMAGILANAERVVEEAGGFIQQSTAGKSEITATCRVPAARLDSVMAALAGLGRETGRGVEVLDVTDEHADLQARLDSKIALRDRMRLLLERAGSVGDILAIEKELARVQAEVESLQGRLDRLESQVDLATLSVSFDQELELGPLGYVGAGAWWVVSKLFVWRW